MRGELLRTQNNPVRLWTIVAVLWIALMVAITLNGGLRAGVGLFSILNAVRLADVKAATIDVDESCFETLIFGLVGTCAVGACIALRAKPIPLALPVVGLATIVAGTFIDMRCSPTVIAALMSSKSYRRCRAADHTIYSFRAHTHFANYVKNAAMCHPFPKGV